MKPFLWAAAAVLLVAGCEGKEAPYRTDMELAEVMAHVIDFGAQAFWASSGYIDTAEGTTSLTPSTEQGWLNAVSGAATVAEGANLLMLPDRARDNGDWMKFARELADRSHEAMAAADEGEAAWLAMEKAREAGQPVPPGEAAKLRAAEVKMFDTGGRMYEVCTACHEKYLVPFLDEEGELKSEAPLKK